MAEAVHQMIADWLRESDFAVAFTGAGISTESGIPDFRSPGGVWAKSQPVYFDAFLHSPEARLEYWRQKAELHDDMASAEPNVAHCALARWESLGLLHGVITQNIDGLHQLAGARNVLELHGTAREISCLDCGVREPAGPLVGEFLATQQVPACRQCGGLLKHATVSFGQQLPADVVEESTAWAGHSDFFLVLGSSLVVYPAAGLPELAKRQGARLVIINREPTPLDGRADIVLHESIGEVLAAVDASVGNNEQS